jgi:hypothetical protein
MWEKSSTNESFSITELEDDVLQGLIQKDINSDTNIKLSM